MAAAIRRRRSFDDDNAAIREKNIAMYNQMYPDALSKSSQDDANIWRFAKDIQSRRQDYEKDLEDKERALMTAIESTKKQIDNVANVWKHTAAPSQLSGNSPRHMETPPYQKRRLLRGGATGQALAVAETPI
eukprot:CAMPEP_0172609702 /NCGR_PEP_ID=MMETSP1068-20121228/29632_1 /TAXON_ID=35684 /ORGANISM="Pseudopedinella elastica, Strain CCMP716" /LENGTH=131 /DNA_ID=CAMNT_0013413267 /DNA_START=292 /DNA_END=687 /DNA_ORIENTATION=-